MRILIAEDEARIARFMERGLAAHGYATTVVEDGISALDLGSSGDFDLLILDVGLPRMDGFQVLKALRGMEVQLPILMVTARTGVDDTVQGLEGGANDYIAKPFRFEELLARVKLRAREASAGAGSVSADELTLGDLSLDLRSRIATCTVDGAERQVELSSREFTMARVFLENPGQVLTRDLLLSKVWGYDYDGASNVVDVYVGYLRGKLGAPRLVTVRGAGYKIVDPAA
ncbi:response regulator transcription factor [Brachybacterium saurashtrense]|uniref:DNA-binding response regulator n=1 Tax=Brachybacterium saurashtrense TaxID=556288 RepID=A0A345YSJ3_9MICO|nr:response regulator transcription factor [Brachybacterium saurashtrense]AXK46895.1 DNA-binding response regulator [Brachybacterium saurashtrense]RRR22610.1 DNA-binding response regulator [Brachybacterium saurashtrense]